METAAVNNIIERNRRLQFIVETEYYLVMTWISRVIRKKNLRGFARVNKVQKAPKTQEMKQLFLVENHFIIPITLDVLSSWGRKPK